MESEANPWVYRRFFLSNLPSAPRLFCCNTPNGFTFGEIELIDEEIQCQLVQTCSLDLQIRHLTWLPNTIFRPSRKEISIGCTTLPTGDRKEQLTLTYNNKMQIFAKTSELISSAIDANCNDSMAISHLNGTVKIYSISQCRLSSEKTFPTYGMLHQLKWHPTASQLLLLSHQNHLNILDTEREKIQLTLSSTGKEHLADCTWVNPDLIVGRHRQHLLLWDRRVSREPIRNDLLDIVGQIEKLKCSPISPNQLLSVYDSRLSKLKIFDFRYLTMRQVESFDQSSSFLDYYWLSNQSAILVATHQGSLHWIEVDQPKKKSIFRKTHFLRDSF